jgi:tRNA pseudouridine-54 N-methylase
MQNKLLIPISIVLAGIIIAGAFVYINQGKIQISSRKELSAQEAAQKAVDYINKNKDRVAGGLSASLINVSEEGNVYKIHLKVGDGEYDSYVTKDGKLLFPQGYNLEEKGNQERNRKS